MERFEIWTAERTYGVLEKVGYRDALVKGDYFSYFSFH